MYFLQVLMAISLAFGVLSATVITMYLVPSLYLMLDDVQRFLGIDKLEDPALVHHKPAAEEALPPLV